MPQLYSEFSKGFSFVRYIKQLINEYLLRACWVAGTNTGAAWTKQRPHPHEASSPAEEQAEPLALPREHSLMPEALLCTLHLSPPPLLASLAVPPPSSSFPEQPNLFPPQAFPPPTLVLAVSSYGNVLPSGPYLTCSHTPALTSPQKALL